MLSNVALIAGLIILWRCANAFCQCLNVENETDTETERRKDIGL